MRDLKRAISLNIKELFFVCFSFILMVVVSIFFIKSNMERQLSSNAEQVLNTAEVVIMSRLREAEVALFNSAVTIQDKLDSGQGEENVVKFMRDLYRHMNWPSDHLPGYMNIYGYIKGKFLNGMGWIPPDDYNPLERPWYLIMHNGDGQGLTSPYVDRITGETVVSVSWSMRGDNGEEYGVLALDMDLDRLSRYVRSLQFSEGGYGLLLDQNLNFISYPDVYYVGRSFDAVSPEHARLSRELKKSQALHGLALTNSIGEDVVAFIRPMSNGWYIGISTPTWNYYRPMYQTFAVLMLLGLTLMLLLSTLLLRFSLAKLRSDASNESKTAFLARMNHEIRTPLNAVIGLSEVELQNDLPVNTRDNLEKIYNSGTILLGIVNDVLDISKIESGKFELHLVKYDLPALINDVAQLNMLRIGSKKITFKIAVEENLPRALYGDELRVKQILNNLLSNAFKYTDAGVVTFDVRGERRHDGCWLTFTVTDTGHGIKKEDVPRVFSAYSQLEAGANRRIEGTGLGLTITKHLTEMMNGSVRLESEFGKGSSFTVLLRQDIADARSIGGAVAASLREFLFVGSRRTRGKSLIREYMPYGRVLVVDDVPTNLDVMRGLLMPYGLNVDYVLSGPEAVEKIRMQKPNYDLVFMDHMMPGMDGIEATRVIRQEIGTEYARAVPIVALTANALAGNREMFLDHGFDGFIAKPIDLLQLDTTLNAWVRDKQSEETLKLAKEQMKKKVLAEKASPAAKNLFSGLFLEGVDLETGVQRYMKDDVYLDILRSYLSHTPAMLDRLRALSQESLPDYAVAVHGLKGSSYGICADNVGHLAEELEFAAKAGNFALVLDGHEALLEKVENLLANLRSLLARLAEKEGVKPRLDTPDKEQLRILLEASRRFKFSDMDKALKSMENFSYEQGSELITWLRRQTDDLEYDAIRDRLELILSSGQIGAVPAETAEKGREEDTGH